MRTLKGVKKSKQPQARKLKCWTSLDDGVGRDVFGEHLDSPMATSSSVHRLGSTTPDGFTQPLRRHTSNAPDFILRPRQVLLKTNMLGKAKEDNTRTLGKSNALPPIYGSRVTSMHSTGTCVPSFLEREARHMGKKANISSVSTVKERALIWRQRDRSQLTSSVGLICRSVAAFRLMEHAQDLKAVQSEQREEGAYGKPRVKLQSCSAHGPSSMLVGLEGNNLSGSDSGVITGKVQDSASTSATEHHAQLLSDSAIETETRSSWRNGGLGEAEKNYSGGVDDQEEYYTPEKIAEWILGVNAILFYPSKEHVNKDQLLEEEDVDTIKIIYDQD